MRTAGENCLGLPNKKVAHFRDNSPLEEESARTGDRQRISTENSQPQGEVNMKYLGNGTNRDIAPGLMPHSTRREQSKRPRGGTKPGGEKSIPRRLNSIMQDRQLSSHSAKVCYHIISSIFLIYE
ncbi:UNVERIFIED_CONTAM: hypothetical protein PYX00_005553 [Menopon gallinae]|uniref:Uncharacterized protein n=1 Tax=Menopon gallinae TaxID=328185 RepID=A0AAW2HSM4_9NEOP